MNSMLIELDENLVQISCPSICETRNPTDYLLFRELFYTFCT